MKGMPKAEWRLFVYGSIIFLMYSSATSSKERIRQFYCDKDFRWQVWNTDGV